MPPLDPTSPSASRIPVRASHVDQRQPRAVARPILASECLKDDIAPLEPFPRLLRAVLAVSGLVALGGAALLLRGYPSVALGAFVGGAAMTTAAAVPSYRVRAAVGALGSLSVAFSILSGEHSWALRSFAAIALASALFTRAGYRAHRGVRVALAVAVAAFAAAAATSFAAAAPTSWGPNLPARIAAGSMAAIAAASLLGFMGEQTTGGAAVWGALVLLTTGASIALSGPFLPTTPVALAAVTTLFSACVAASIAIFAIAASVIAPIERAREHRTPVASPEPVHDND